MIPRQEHPNPQFERTEWLNLNGTWEFEIDKSVSGKARLLYEAPHLAGSITVPFCPESTLSGIGDRDFLNCVWYRRDVEIPADWKGGRVLLHFGAVDHRTTVYINGKEIGTHVGGFSSFSFDITDALTDTHVSLCLSAEDDTRDSTYGHGKQSSHYESHGCFYTRVTGIWQTVWLEHVPSAYIRSFRFFPDPDNACLGIEADVVGGGTLCAEASFGGKPMGKLSLNAPNGGTVRGTLALDELHLWEVGNGRLYDLSMTFGEDRVSSYFGMRSLAFDGFRFLLNGKSVFQRLVLDQGYYPDGLYTAPDEDALVRDIRLSMDVGFNGARLHQKVFEPRFLYHCDKMGYMVWGEYGSWGLDLRRLECLSPLLAEWRDIVNRDFNHPAIIGWCPLNEVWPSEEKGMKNLNILRSMYQLTKDLDATRPCIDASGGYHTEANDIFDLHEYEQDATRFAQMMQSPVVSELLKAWEPLHPNAYRRTGAFIEGQPIFVSEYGGIKWDINSGLANAWGYGDAPKTEEEFIARYRDLTNVLLDNPSMFGFCYTQLYDIEQEVNGLYTYDRTPKFDDMSVFYRVNTKKAAIED